MTFTGISQDTRQLKKGEIFFDIIGCSDRVRSAIHLGAAAIISPVKETFNTSIPFIYTDNPRLMFARACDVLFQKQPDIIAAITGTNGKTSTADFIRQLYLSLKIPAASIGTLGVKGAQTSFEIPSLTTLDAYHLHKVLADLAEKNIDAVALEASSHGLDQYRLDGVRVKYAVFTNLTQDHLDYHQTMDHYFQAKTRLFLEVMDASGIAIINKDDTYGQELLDLCQEKKIRTFSYSLEDASADLYGSIEQIHGHGLRVSIKAFDHQITVDIPVVGLFQVANILAAVGVILASTPHKLSDIKSGLEKLQSPSGRMDYVGKSILGGCVFVDYAHTPDALKRALQSLRAHTANQIHVVFGCGGDRDRSKRLLMGEIAKKWADRVIVTDDNPRTEDPKTIRQAVLLGCPEALEKADREEAIATAIAALKEGDSLLIAGKGHEQGQMIGKENKPFCDRKVALKYLKGV